MAPGGLTPGWLAPGGQLWRLAGQNMPRPPLSALLNNGSVDSVGSDGSCQIATLSVQLHGANNVLRQTNAREFEENWGEGAGLKKKGESGWIR